MAMSVVVRCAVTIRDRIFSLTTSTIRLTALKFWNKVLDGGGGCGGGNGGSSSSGGGGSGS